jgi:RNA polymerase sigma-70 factor (ECF subfamily)
MMVQWRIRCFSLAPAILYHNPIFLVLCSVEHDRQGADATTSLRLRLRRKQPIFGSKPCLRASANVSRPLYNSRISSPRSNGQFSPGSPAGNPVFSQSIMSTADVEDLPSLLPGMLPRLWAFSLRLCGNQHDAEDVLQRACVRGLERAHQLQPGTSPLSWMFSIVHSTWINELRARNVRTRSSMEWDDNFLETVADPGARNPETTLMSSEIIAAVERLPEAQRIVMLLVAVEGLSYSEAAEVLGVPIGTIMSRLSRARQTIGAQFGERDAPASRSVKTQRATR